MKAETLNEQNNYDNLIEEKDYAIAEGKRLSEVATHWQKESEKLKVINDSLLSALKEITASYMVCVRKADQSEYVINAKAAISKAEE